MPNDKIYGEGYIDVSGFRFAAKALRKASPELRLELLRNLKAAGNLVAKDAKANASRYSESIPPTIKVKVRGVGVAVQAGGNYGGASDKTVGRELFEAGHGTSGSESSAKRAEEGVVIAGLFELGNRGGGKSEASRGRGEFRHPVFNDDVWVNQQMHPYLVPAGKKNEPATTALVLEALSAVTKIIVFESHK